MLELIVFIIWGFLMTAAIYTPLGSWVWAWYKTFEWKLETGK